MRPWRKSYPRRRPLWRDPVYGSALALLLVVAVVPVSRSAQSAAPRVAFRIPSQPLDEALLALAQQAGVQLVAVGDLARVRRSVELSGVMSVEAAFKRLLAGTNFDFELRSGVITVNEIASTRAVEQALARPIVSANSSLATVVVTARRRDERWIDVPMAVSMLDTANIEALGLTNAIDAVNLMPGVTGVDRGGAFTQVQMRGVSSSLAGNDNGYYLDDAPFTGLTVPWHPDTRAFDLERIEVLKGPQGTLFGEGSMGGTVRITTRPPQLDQVAATVRAGVSSTHGGGVGGSGKVMLNAPLVTDRLAVRAVGMRETLPGWIDAADGRRDINEQRIGTQRIRLRWSPSDNWLTDVGFVRMSTEAPGGDYSANDELQTDVPLATSSRWHGTMLSSQYDLPASRLTLLRSDAELHNSLDGHVAPTSFLQGTIAIDTDNTELRWASTGGDGLDWLIGYAHRAAMRMDNLTIDGMPSENGQSHRADALFGEVKVPVRPYWSFTAGLRYFTEDVSTHGHIQGTALSEQADFHRLIPRLSLSWQTLSSQMIYGSFATGFRSGQVQPIESLARADQVGLEIPIAIAPDSLRSYEIGFKQALLDGRLRLQSALFYSRWRDLPVRVPIDDLFNSIANSKGATLRGAELELRYAPSNAVDVGMSATYTDARYDADVPNTAVRKGAPVYNVPRMSLAGWVAYGWTSSAGTVSVAANVRHHSRRETGLVGQSSGGDPITALDLRVGLASPQGWGVYAYGDNLTNERGAVDGRTTFDQAARLHPRNVGLEVEYRY